MLWRRLARTLAPQSERYVPMRSRTVTTVAVALVTGCTMTASNNRSRLEPAGTYIEIFERYNSERRALSITELEDAFRTFLEDPSQENREHLDRVYGTLDVTRVLDFLVRDNVSRSTYECLQHVECGAYAKGTMKLWAIARFKPTYICRGSDARWARLHYRGTSEDGMTAYGIVDFLKEGDTWKISFESFGEQEDPEHNKPLQATCEDARA